MPVPQVLDSLADPAADAARAAHAFGTSSGEVRSTLLEALALALEQHREGLVGLAHEETHLGAARLNGELDRTCFQLRAFAQHVLRGALSVVEEDLPIAGAPPLGRPRMGRVQVPLGPVAMFSASNFPFAFSVLGGDTASALAAGCPVVVRGHPAHPRLSVAVFRLAQEVLARQGLPSGVLGLVQGDSIGLGIDLVRHPAIKAVAFTGSLRAGLALEAVASQRTPPIPFFGELGSVNPLVILPGALSDQVPELAGQLAGSVALGMGQFCTRPGVVALCAGDEATLLVGELVRQLAAAPVHSMLTLAMEQAYVGAVRRVAQTEGVRVLLAPAGDRAGPFLATVDAGIFLQQPQLRHEVFGPAVLVVVCKSDSLLEPVMASVAGSLTVTLWGAEDGTPLARSLVAAATRCAGRVLFGGVPTGVAVTRAQHHGGPWPASTQPAFTSVGLHACARFLRPVVYQSAPAWLIAA